MIGRLTGLLIEKRPPTVVVEVHGIGYEVDVPMSTFFLLPATGSVVTLQTHLIVREDAHLLFGFATDEERKVFRQLLKISGVGARTALSVLSGMSVSELFQTVSAHDGARLTRIPGIGKKTAERLLLELRDKLGAGTGTVIPGGEAAIRSDALNALLALGYSDREATHALGSLAPETPVQDAIRHALKLLSKA
ncbi:MAG TPA: Holliday junction branch migration protein RuvA [Burkholderiales bacterium]|nr:Holliday junction branch migration protein RuvA [Burkholderiales bacterium]